MDWTIPLTVAYFLVLAFLLWLIWPIFIGAIFLPTPPVVVDKMLTLAEVGKGDIVYDLGSGDGRIIIEAAKRGAVSIGVEADPIRVLWSRVKSRSSSDHSKIRVIWGDFFKTKITDATVVTVYQGESINNRLREKFDQELRPGTRIVSYSFTFDSWEIAAKYNDPNIYLYRVPAKA